VPDITTAIQRLGDSRCRLVSGPTPAVLFDGRHVSFLLSPTGLIELLEMA